MVAFWDLPKQDPRSHELSGIAWDDRRQVLYAIADKTPQLTELVPDATFHRWRFGGQIAVGIPGQWDGEGLALTEKGFLLSSEFGPRIYEVSRTGAWTATLPLPAHFQPGRPNLSLEALTVTADQRYLFTASEQALPADGPLATRQAGTVVRILRYDRSNGDQREYAYRTDPVFLGRGEGELGVAEVAALSSQDLLVMERSYVPGSGNSVRIYRVSIDGARNILPVEALEPDGAVLKKTLVLDLSTLPDDIFPAPAAFQPSKALANFEGMALGPRLGPGERLLFLVSDDNTRPTQLARLLVLVIADGP